MKQRYWMIFLIPVLSASFLRARMTNFSFKISSSLGSVLEEYGTNLDIIYDDGVEFNKLYGKYIFWNGTIYSP